MNRQGKLGLVPPRYGKEVIGGAEAVLREMAHGLSRRGWDVEVLTTCARDHFTWENEYEAGVEAVEGITLRRFPTVVGRRPDRARLESAILAGADLTLEEQQIWMNGGLRVPELFHFLLDHASDYRALMFAPYLFWTTFACAQIAPERTILLPCLHDEPYANLEIFKPVFSGARAIWFWSDPEMEVARRIFDLPERHRVIGAGLHVPPSYDPEGFRVRHGIKERFLLYAGRREGAKGWEKLLDDFAGALARRDLPFSLVTVGSGDVHPPADVADRVIDLGLVSEDERNNAFAAADGYLQPSGLESFSRTIMEAWLAGTLVIANAAGEVVAWHCERSGAGLAYEDEFEFEQCLSFLAAAPEEASRLAAKGRDYVLGNYTWPATLDRVESALEEWF